MMMRTFKPAGETRFPRSAVISLLLAISMGLAACVGGYSGPVRFIISGQVTFSGEGYGGATVTLTDDLSDNELVGATITDDLGEYAFTGLSNGTYTVTVFVEVQEVTPASIPGIVIARDDSFGHDFALVTHTISGRVTLEGEGYPDVLLTLSGDTESSTATDLSGDYSFPELLNGDYTVTPSSSVDTFDPAFMDVKVNSEDEFLEEFVVVLPDTFIIRGTVTLNGADNDWITITLTNSAAEALSTTPDASGNYSFANLLPGEYTVTPSSELGAFTPEVQNVTITDADVTEVAFTFNPFAYSISGTVTLNGGDPAGITLTLTRDTTIVATATPGDSGVYAFPGLLPGTYTVTPSGEGEFSPSYQEVIITIEEGDVTGVDFTFTPDLYFITGTVTLNGGDPAGITLTLTSGAATVDITTPNSSGAYFFAGLLPGTYTVTPSGPGLFSPAYRDVLLRGNTTGVNFTFAPDRHTISGTVILDGGNPGEITLTLTSGAAIVDTTTPDDSGAYSFADLLPGTYRVTPSGPGLFSPEFRDVALSGNTTGVNFTFTLDTYSISGTVLEGIDGKEGVTVALSGDDSGSVVTDESGTYSFTDLLPGDYTVTPSSSDLGEFDPEFQNVTITDADFPGVDFTFSPAAEPLGITGPVTNP